MTGHKQRQELTAGDAEDAGDYFGFIAEFRESIGHLLRKHLDSGPNL